MNEMDAEETFYSKVKELMTELVVNISGLCPILPSKFSISQFAVSLGKRIKNCLVEKRFFNICHRHLQS